METLDLCKELEAFVEAIDSFPASDEKSQFYNIEKLLSTKEYGLLNDFFGEEEHKKALRLIHKAQEAIKLCKIGELDKGYAEFQDMQEKAKALSKNASLYAQLYYLSGLAYYHFKRGDFQIALEYTWEEIKETEKLEEKGATTLHYRRAGHVGNATKILYVSGKIAEATKLLLGDILYSLNGDTSLMPVGNWNHKLLDFIPYIRQRYFDISFLNAIEKLVEKQGNSGEEDYFFYQNVFSKIPDFEVKNNNSAIIHNWLYLQRLYYDKSYKEFVLCFIEFCEVPFDSTFDLLKLVLLPKIILLMKNSNTNIDFKDKGSFKINNYIRKKINSKQFLKQRVCNLILE
jgi:hypothetical protein